MHRLGGKRGKNDRRGGKNKNAPVSVRAGLVASSRVGGRKREKKRRLGFCPRPTVAVIVGDGSRGTTALAKGEA
jgi:hypothetical protein